MKCSKPDCENEATVHLTEIVEGKMQKNDLCEECAREKGVTDPEGFTLADLLLGLGPKPTIKEPADASRRISSRTDTFRFCPVCQMEMLKVQLFEMTVNVCQHGIWLDREELPDLLRRFNAQQSG